MAKIKKDEIRARLVVHDIQGMNRKELRFFRKWIKSVAEELNSEDPKAFAKLFRATLYKQDQL